MPYKSYRGLFKAGFRHDSPLFMCMKVIYRNASKPCIC
nr:MAG TPA_asm: hypothetical protein [Caudoviricetes sp.]